MVSKTKIIIAVIITALLTYYLTKEFTGNYEAVGKTADTTSTVTTKYTYTENTFSALQVGKIKKVLIDSLSAVYKSKILKVFAGPVPAKPEIENEKPVEASAVYAYTSEIDSTFVAKDSTGKTTDSMKVKSTVVSPIPLDPRLIHLLSIKNYSREKETIREKKITETVIVEKKKSLFEIISIKPTAVAGYDVINGKFGIMVGMGITVGF